MASQAEEREAEADSFINKVFAIFESEGWSDVTQIAVLNHALFAGMQAGFGISKAQAGEILQHLLKLQMLAGINIDTPLVEATDYWHKIVKVFPDGTDTAEVMTVLTIVLRVVLESKVGESKAREITNALTAKVVDAVSTTHKAGAGTE